MALFQEGNYALLSGWFDEIEKNGDGKLEKKNFVNNLPEAFFQIAENHLEKS